VTTQHIDPEHSDVEVSVVEHLPVSESEPAISTPAPASEEAVPTTGNVGVDTPVGAPPVSSPIVEEEVRPFTDFIEEFRQAESRFTASLQDYQRETTSSTTPVGVQFIEPEAGPQLKEPEAETQLKEPTTTPSPARPVSPLLRPASPRIRMPRHGSGRQREELAVEKNASTETPAPAESAQAQTGQAQSEETQSGAAEEQPRPARRYRFDRPAAATTSVPPLTGPAATSPLQPRAEESVRDSTAVPVRPDNGHVTNGQTGEREIQQPSQHTKQAANVVQLPEQHTPKQPAVQEAAVAESSSGSSTSTSPTTTPSHDRRRHGQERQRAKAQTPPTIPAPAATVAPVTETATVAPEPVPPVGAQSIEPKEVDPEDLPPLEYAEIQKANTRRRRRRHPGSPASPATAVGSTPLAAVTKAVTPDLPTAPVLPVLAPSVVVPRTPMPTNTAAPASPATQASPAQFTITSGYTVNQMNQSPDGSGPFMGPDPSPARGSSASQHVRSLRTDVQRTPSYPVRTTEATSASVHQLASVVSQAIQTQTDRMVAELRRANQSPTNISVSMPPFPSNERVGVFVDVANLLYSARTLRMTVDFGKLLDFLRGNRRLIRAQAYCPTSPQAGDEQMFLQAVKGLGYRITTKNYKTFSSGAKKADLDLDLCMDVVRLVDGRAVDCIVLVSGDSDFMPMLDYCSDHGVRVEVAAFDEAMSATLRQSCDLFINLSMLDEIRA